MDWMDSVVEKENNNKDDNKDAKTDSEADGKEFSVGVQHLT